MTKALICIIPNCRPSTVRRFCESTAAIGGWQVGGHLQNQYWDTHHRYHQWRPRSGASPSHINVSCFTLPTISASSPFASQCAGFPDAADPAPAGQVYWANLLGNAGRNTIIGPKLVNLDFSVTKNFPIRRISETFNVQFRAEIFNILNHSNFVPPEPLTGASVFDQGGAPLNNGFLDNLSTQPRDVQFALKIIW